MSQGSALGSSVAGPAARRPAGLRYEYHIELQQPSPECYLKAAEVADASQCPPETEPIENPTDANETANANDVPPEEALDQEVPQSDRDCLDGAWEVGDDGEGLVTSNAVDAEDEVAITVRRGEVQVKTSQVADYVHRGPLLDDVCLWDYISRVEKISKKENKRLHRGPNVLLELDPYHSNFTLLYSLHEAGHERRGIQAGSLGDQI
ncbi:hypothetical protein C8J56DRAFT_887171 [Mycena floridula]|nr:hypothetical protein C8J56DRAFT_887171 [Mycena floridula]